MAKHSAGPSRTRYAIRVRSLLMSGSVLVVAAVLGLSMANGTYALYNTSTTLGAATITTGSTSLTIDSVTDRTVPSLFPSTLYPGRSLVTAVPLVFANTGSTALSFTIGAATFPVAETVNASISVAVTPATGAACTASVPGQSLVQSSAATTLAAGARISMCLEVRLAATAPASVQATDSVFTVPVAVVQVRP
jgi:hypothetical protein